VADLQAEGRLFDAEPLGCAGKMQLLGDRNEMTDVPQVHLPTTSVDRLSTCRHREKPGWISNRGNG
jgi:hypothetical protein